MGLYKFIEQTNMPQPVTLEIKMVKVRYDRNRQGRDARYMKVYARGSDITQICADILGRKLSEARDTYGCIIVHGSGMDMCYDLANRIYNKACEQGYPDMFVNGYTDFTVANSEDVRYSVHLGPNTKQFWIYDNDSDEYIDPPTEVLEEADNVREQKGWNTAEGIQAAENYIYDVANANPTPEWMFDKEYIFDGNMDI